MSKHSVTKRGFVQRETKEAIDVLQEFPRGAIFLIPVRLDGTEPVDEELRELNWVDLVPDYHSGLSRILSALTEVRREPLQLTRIADAPTLPARFIDKGREITVEVPLLIGPRAAVSYAPFRSKKEYLQQFFDRLPSESAFADTSLSYYVTLDTRDAGVLLGDDLKARYPEQITLVLQNTFRQLETRKDGVSVILSFGGIPRTIGFSFDAIRQIRVPEIGLTVVLEQPGPEASLAGPVRRT
jgi:hypothetical protein